MRLHLGQATEVLRVSTSVAGTFTERFVIDEGACLAGLVVRSVTGTVTAYLDTEADRGESARVLTWPGATQDPRPLPNFSLDFGAEVCYPIESKRARGLVGSHPPNPPGAGWLTGRYEVPPPRQTQPAPKLALPSLPPLC